MNLWRGLLLLLVAAQDCHANERVKRVLRKVGYGAAIPLRRRISSALLPQVREGLENWLSNTDPQCSWAYGQGRWCVQRPPMRPNRECAF